MRETDYGMNVYVNDTSDNDNKDVTREKDNMVGSGG